MEVLKKSDVSAAVQISETEARLLSLAVDYWKDAMDSGSPLVADLSTRLREISQDFENVLEDSDRES